VSVLKKLVIALIISVLLFAGMIFLLDFEPFDFVRTRFYNPSFVSSVVKENEKAAEIVQNHILELQNKFADALNEPAVKNSFLYNQTAADIYERSRIFGILVESINGLQAVQFVDSNGVRIHYSTSTRDLISQNNNSATYRNYTDDSRALPYEDISAGANESPKYIMDDLHDRIIFSFPFYDSMNVYRGTALFTLSVRVLADRLIAEGSLKPSDDISVIRFPRGIVFGSPSASKSVILGNISSAWKENFKEYITLDAEDAGVKYALISIKTGNDLFFGRIINDSIFSISDSLKIIFQLSMFLTLFLALFFLINSKQHPITLVQNRISKLRANLFEELYIKKTGQDRAKWILELEQRRDEIRFELKSRLSVRRSLENKIDNIIDKSLDELLAVMKSGYDLASLEEIVKNRVIKVEKPQTAEKQDEIDKIEEIEEVEAVDEAEPVDEAEEIEEFDEIEEVEDAQEIDEIEDADAIEEAEEIEDAEEIEEIEEAEPVEEAEELEEIEEIKPFAEIQLSKSLLNTASDILAKIKKKEEKTAAPARAKRGLLKRAIEYLNSKEPSVTHTGRKGLLNLALKFLNSIDNKRRKGNEKGLLAKATTYHAALLSENLSVREIDEDLPEDASADAASEIDENGQGLLFDMEVVSPFSSMFPSLENGTEDSTSSTNAD